MTHCHTIICEASLTVDPEPDGSDETFCDAPDTLSQDGRARAS
jgi:hypothetical protein